MAEEQVELKPRERRTPEEIRRSIVERRAEMDVIADALQEKLEGGRLVEELRETLRRHLGSNPTLTHFARRHPVPMALVAAAAAWLLVEIATGRGRPTPEPIRRRGRSHGVVADPRPGQEASEARERRMGGALWRAIEQHPLRLGAACLGLGVIAGMSGSTGGEHQRPMGPPGAGAGR
jgi:hypothetical protein